MAAIDEAISTYLTALAIEGKTDNTIKSYAASLADFRRTAARLGLPDRVEQYTISHVYAFLGALKDRGVSPAYRHRRHREVKAFFSWCRRMELVTENVFARVPLVRLEQKIFPPFEVSHIYALLAVFEPESRSGLRNRAIVLFLLDTGVRASECAGVRFEDIDWERSRVLVRHTKNRDDRWVGFSEPTASALHDYIDRFRGETAGSLFITSSGKPMRSGHTLSVILTRAAKRAGLAKVHPHRFRHTFATWAIQSGAREIDVQMLLGHSSLTMVQRYSRTYTSEQAVLAHADLSPVNRLAG